MKSLTQKIVQAARLKRTNPPVATVCNYRDNYYGDQVCVANTNS